MTSAPAWIIALHYFFVIVTLPGVCTAIFRKQRLICSIIAFFILLTAQLTFFMVALGRGEGFNEFERLINRTGHGSLPALYSVAGFLYLLFWWILILPKKTRAN